MFLIPNNKYVYILRRAKDNNVLSYSCNIRHDNDLLRYETYVIGFQKKYFAENIRKLTTASHKIHLTRQYNYKNITNDINHQLNIHFKECLPVTNVVMESDVMLHIPLKNKNYTTSDADNYELDIIDYDSFHIMPISKNIGIILPYSTLDNKNDSYITLGCNLIEPTYDVNSFKMFNKIY